MTMITIELPDDVARQAIAADIFSEDQVRHWLAYSTRRKAANALFEAVQSVRAVSGESMDEYQVDQYIRDQDIAKH